MSVSKERRQDIINWEEGTAGQDTRSGDLSSIPRAL